MNSIEKEDFTIQIRDKLRKDGVKLWLAPYYNDTTCASSSADIERISQNYSEGLNIPSGVCKEIIGQLQVVAIENLKQKNEFEKSGKATIKIKILQAQSPARIITKEILLSMRAIDLKDILSNDTNISMDRLKLISSGKVLIDGESLGSQSVKNGQNLLAIIVSETPNEVLQKEKEIKQIEDVKTDSRLLALDDNYMQIEDQFGNAIKIPKAERKALTVAMALNEKGKAALKKEDYSKALIYFLEAEHEFKVCTSKILNSVDNFALLDLDIAWCYLCLQSFTQLPEAYVRLKRCEEKFHSTYGNNMERLIAIKGSAGNEAALFMRLHLLQAIVLYHQNSRGEALRLFRQAENELQCLQVDETGLMSLVELGFSPAEARLGLRVSRGDVNRAANFVNENREKRKEARQKAMADEIMEKEKKKLGKCADGKQYVDPNFLRVLVNMGYNREIARRALQRCNNIISDSVQYIQENPLPGPSETKSQEFLAYIEELMPELVEAGFDPRMARLSLQNHCGDIMKAAEELISNNGVVPGDISALNMAVASIEEIQRKQAEKKEAFKRLKEDIEMVDDDHLDLTLVREETFLKQYLSLLEKDQ
ncbi:unnamed protein product [Brassicogethes aeneus]|uniref:NEDD8 ultimate buster 1 n=1 Tax=Brassicogethes aeneus TaxID=1431903 RepID=A0A9P0BEK3_BRAAE|nr:unnamed protein product [Brassicogethes aeneus]